MHHHTKTMAVTMYIFFTPTTSTRVCTFVSSTHRKTQGHRPLGREHNACGERGVRFTTGSRSVSAEEDDDGKGVSKRPGSNVKSDYERL